MISFAPKTKNFFRRIVWNGCARPWWVYLVTFLPAYGEAAITLGIWDMEDLVRSQGRAIATEGQKRTGRGMGHAKKSRIPTDPRNKERYAAKALRTLIVFTQPLENIGFALLAYHAADQFYYRWGSLIEAIAPCNPLLDAGTFMRSAENVGWGLLASGGPAPMVTLNQDSGNWGGTGFFVDVPPGKYFMVFAANLKAHSGTISGVKIRILAPTFLGGTDADSDTQDINDKHATSFVASIDIFITGIFGGRIAWETAGVTVPIGCLCESARIVISRSQLQL